MSPRLKTVGRCFLYSALTGFAVGILLAVMAFRMVGVLPAGVYLLLCPPSIASMAFDSATTETAVRGWIVISIVNAGLYGVVGLVIGFLKSLR